MTPDRLRGWLKKIPAGARGIQLAVEVEGAGLVPIGNWEREDAKALQDQPGDRDLAAALIDQAQEYADAEGTGQKFVIRWIGQKDAILKSTTHRVQPTAAATDDGEPTTEIDGVTDATIIRDLLKAHEAKDKQLAGAVNTLTEAYGRVIGMLTTQLTGAYNALAEEKAREAPSVAATVVELTPEQKEESFQRAEAMKAFTSKLPDVLELLIAAGAKKLLPTAEESAAESSGLPAVPDMEE